MSRSRISAPRRIVFALAICSGVPLLAACPKKETPAIDAAPPPPPPEEDVQTVLVPMEEDAEVPDTGPDVKKATGPGVPTNVLRLRQCCNALAAEAKRMGSSPEAGMFTAAAAQCSAMAAQIGPGGNAPELGAIRGLLAGRNIPAVCGGF
ncbi:MAG TPA: hypothetical protein VM580_33540 [Labilithrix sp.]|jgi:hypothetical protein|nr:hypothetical protein [Labilithrix sp.]